MHPGYFSRPTIFQNKKQLQRAFVIFVVNLKEGKYHDQNWKPCH